MIENEHHVSDRRRRRGRIGRFSIVLCAGLALSSPGPRSLALAQPSDRTAQSAGADSVFRIDADYRQQRARLDRERITRLTRLAESQKEGEAESTFLEVFRFAIATDRYTDAEPAAERVMKTGATNRDVELLAQLVNIIAEAERGDYESSTRDLKTYLAGPVARAAGTPQVQTRTLLTIGEAYFRRLIQGRKFDLAREVCDLLIQKAGVPAVRDHFSGYRRRLDLVGRPAPAIAGTDSDGAEVGLDHLKGKVVLVVFWATWCPPCTERLPALRRALELHEKAGFAVLGVNVDSGPDREPLVRRFIVDFGIPWPNALSGQGERDIAARYAVTEIPANVLIGRDGKVMTFDLDASNLLDAVSQAVGQPRESR